ncbi:TPA: hypothetical protein ACH3X2_003539 [Trebouxia sp. C0005]
MRLVTKLQLHYEVLRKLQASLISTARSADRQPAKPIASAASTQDSGQEAASKPVCAECRKSFAAIPKPIGHSDPPLSLAATSRKTPSATVSALSGQQAPTELTQGTGQQHRPDATPVGGIKAYVPGDFLLHHAKHFLQSGTSPQLLSLRPTMSVKQAA